jgi:hypothetical protein
MGEWVGLSLSLFSSLVCAFGQNDVTSVLPLNESEDKTITNTFCCFCLVSFCSLKSFERDSPCPRAFIAGNFDLIEDVSLFVRRGHSLVDDCVC